MEVTSRGRKATRQQMGGRGEKHTARADQDDCIGWKSTSENSREAWEEGRNRVHLKKIGKAKSVVLTPPRILCRGTEVSFLPTPEEGKEGGNERGTKKPTSS